MVETRIIRALNTPDGGRLWLLEKEDGTPFTTEEVATVVSAMGSVQGWSDDKRTFLFRIPL